MAIEYDTRTAKSHSMGGKEHGWSYQDHERAMLAEAGDDGWILCAIKPGMADGGGATLYYFYRTYA